MNVRIFLLRHGQTDWNKEYRYQGRTDVPLNRTGIEQAHHAADGLAGFGIDMVVASPLRRAAETGRIIADHLGLDLGLHSDLVEISHGRWEGETLERVGEEYLEIIGSWKQDPYGGCAPGGESIGQVRDRALAAIDEIISDYNCSSPLVVGHDGTLRAVRLGLVGLGFEHYLEYGLKPGRVIELTGSDEGFRESGSKQLW